MIILPRRPHRYPIEPHEYSRVKYITDPANGNHYSVEMEITIPEYGNHN